jgi:hypothetical protein
MGSIPKIARKIWDATEDWPNRIFIIATFTIAAIIFFAVWKG